MTSETWQRGAKPFDPKMLLGRDCVVGVGLARKNDIAAVVLVFPMDGGYYLPPRFFLPADGLAQRELRDHAPYAKWARTGLLTLTEGGRIGIGAILGVFSSSFGQVTAVDSTGR